MITNNSNCFWNNACQTINIGKISATKRIVTNRGYGSSNNGGGEVGATAERSIAYRLYFIWNDNTCEIGTIVKRKFPYAGDRISNSRSDKVGAMREGMSAYPFYSIWNDNAGETGTIAKRRVAYTGYRSSNCCSGKVDASFECT